jgi:hypothetical protein
MSKIKYSKSFCYSAEIIYDVLGLDNTNEICYSHRSGTTPYIRIPDAISDGLEITMTCFKLVSCLAYFTYMKMKATCSSEKLVDFQRTIHRYIPEDRILH